MSDIPSATTSNVPLTKLAVEINRLHQMIAENSKTAIEQAIEAGQMLMEAKKKIGHAGWLNWLQHNCPNIPERTASHYMRLASKRPELEKAAEANRQRVADLSIRSASRLLSKPREPEQAKGEKV